LWFVEAVVGEVVLGDVLLWKVVTWKVVLGNVATRQITQNERFDDDLHQLLYDDFDELHELSEDALADN